MSPRAQSRDDTPGGCGHDQRDTASRDDLAYRTGAAVNDATGPAICSSKGPTCEPSSTPLLVSSAAMICPVSASTPIWSFRQDRRALVACLSTSHPPGPQSLSPVLSTSRCTGSLPGRGGDTGNVSPRRLTRWPAAAITTALTLRAGFRLAL